MPETKTYSGGCHCGRVGYEVTTDLAVVMACNCSHCSKEMVAINVRCLDDVDVGGLQPVPFNGRDL